ncbi:hypothetical protein EJK17_07880 [Lactobacillus xujianguonis]|uniref:Uncharacterized protein n=1 Tax=Lactobacillus xujianguonis TaxID=2495899 RepID=A0A437STZ3_9LACO|nr:hypothetical protein [Lactobacillus xujianguonis]RVU70421.1 hypothetical protein EJK17_07880 [Lactobacillus xujianguonis]
MADENTNAVTGAETATQEQPVNVKTYVYYYSDPDGATKGERCHEVFTDTPFDVVPWRMHKEAPNIDMKDPVWDDKLNNGLGAWKENSGTAQGQILAQAQATIAALNDKAKKFDQKTAELDQANSKVDEAVKALQQTQQVGTQQSQIITETLGKLMKQQQSNNQLMVTMQQTMMGLAKQVNTTVTPTSDNQASSNNQ